MPRSAKAGRARNTVPQQYDRQPRKAQPKSKTSPDTDLTHLLSRAQIVAQTGLGDEDSLPLPLELWFRVAHFASPLELCHAEILNRAGRHALLRDQRRLTLWSRLCELDFPSMWSCVSQSETSSCSGTPLQTPLTSPTLTAVSAEPHVELDRAPPGDAGGCSTFWSLPCAAVRDGSCLVLDWKVLYTRRFLKQRVWAARARARTSSGISDGQDASASGRMCIACGEHFMSSPSVTQCVSHPGEFLPRQSLPGRTLEHLGEVSTLSQWGRAELNQLQVFVKAAWRSAGGSSGVCRNARNFRGGGHWAKYMGFKGWGSRGHWAEGCGPRPGSRLLRDCIDGKIPCAWSCCGSEELISRGCAVSEHRA